MKPYYRFFSLFFCLCLCFSFAACGATSSEVGTGGSKGRPAITSTEIQFTPVQEGSLIAVLSTSKGDITVLLYPEYAGWAVDNFTRLAKEGYYDNTTFHRVIADFVIQGGDPTGTGEGGESIWKKPFPVEINSRLRHYSGALCMAKDNTSNSILGSQFYIVSTPAGNFDEEQLANFSAQGMTQSVLETYQQAGGAPYLDNTDTVFGQVISGMDVVDSIASVSTNDENVPKKEVTILSVTISSYQASSNDSEPSSNS